MKENGEPIRVAHIMGKWLGGGVESVVMNYYKHIDRTGVQFDFICDSDSTNIPYELIASLGGRVILVPPYQKPISYHKALKKVLENGQYDIVHSHINTLSVFSLFAASRAGIPVRIAHSHSTSNKLEWKKDVIKSVLKPFSTVFATHYMACTEHAGRWLFGDKLFDSDKVYVLNNAIDVEKFDFDESVRWIRRMEFCDDNDTLLVGHVGRFVEAKNQKFVVQIFKELHDMYPNSKLVLVGTGPMVEEVRQLVFDLQLSDCVQFLGQRDDVNELYQAMDVLLLPSLYEGLGMVLIEGQCSGCQCLASTEVPGEAKLTENIDYMDLSEEACLWALRILNVHINARERRSFSDEVSQAGYGILDQSSLLSNYYNSIIRGR